MGMRRMNALVLEGSELAIRSLAIPEPGPGEALVRVTACGVCHTDLHVINGHVSFPRPAVLGHEISGTVVAFGPDCVTGLSIGDDIVGAFIMPCERCSECARGRDDLCTTFFEFNRLQGKAYDGGTRLRSDDGEEIASYSMAGLAEYCVVPTGALARRPAGLDPVASCILGCAGLTAYGALARTAQLEPGDTIAVIGVGGVGGAIIQLAIALGASHVVAVDLDDEKLAHARDLGAHSVVNSATEEASAAVKAILQRGADVVVEAVGLPATFNSGSRMLADGGRMVVVGIAPQGVRGEVEITPLVRRGHHIAGSFGGRTRQDLPAVLDLARTGGIDVGRAVTRRFALADAPHAFQLLDSRKIIGRAVVHIND